MPDDDLTTYALAAILIALLVLVVVAMRYRWMDLILPPLQ